MDFSMSAIAQQAIVKGTRDILEENAVLSESNGYLFDKYQPTSLRQVVATHLYKYWSDAGLLFDIKDIVVSPYSSLMLLEAVLETVAKPNGIILCPEGFYKSNITHVEKYGLSLVSFPSDPQQDARVLAEVLRQAIQEHRQNLCAVLLTMPGNPFVVDYDLEELQDIGKVIIEEDVKVIIDAAFHGIQPDYIPFASVKLDIQEQSYSLFNHSVTISSISKSHHAIGPYKIATAMSGNADWLASIRKRLSIPFQRETTFFAKIIIQNTPEQYIQANCQVMMERQDQAKERLQHLNQFNGITYSYVLEHIDIDNIN
jgi:aspartate/methionine/tyrosine aminotransferase